jgi:hypothetical protein
VEFGLLDGRSRARIRVDPLRKISACDPMAAAHFAERRHREIRQMPVHDIAHGIAFPANVIKQGSPWSSFIVMSTVDLQDHRPPVGHSWR